MYGFIGCYTKNKNQKIKFNNASKRILKQFSFNKFDIFYQLPQKNTKELSCPQFVFEKKTGIAIIFEGKIYNKNEISKKIKGNLKNNNEAEIILRLYKKYNNNLASKIDGIFSFAVIEERKSKIILVRDRIGVKPMYYYQNDDVLIFGTHCELLINNNYYKKKINIENLYSYFFSGINFSHESIHKNIYNLDPGKILIFNNNKITKKSYWGIPKQFIDVEDERSMKSESNDLYKVFYNSIKKVVGDNKKVAVSLSGGLDSTSILSVLLKQNIAVNTYTADFSNCGKSKHSDYNNAVLTADRFNVSNKCTNLTPELYIDKLENELSSINLLYNDTLFNYFTCKWIGGNNESTIFEGDGAEELFAGNRRHFFAYLVDLQRKRYMNQDHYDEIFLEHSKKYFSRYIFGNPRYSLVRNRHKIDKVLFWQEDCRKEISRIDYSEIFDKCFKDCRISGSFLTNILWLEFFYFICKNTYSLYDTISRRNDIEICLPFAEWELVEKSFKIPWSLKINPWTFKNRIEFFKTQQTVEMQKYIFRQSMEKHLSKKYVCLKKKIGSSVPINYWLLEPAFEKYIKHILNEKALRSGGLLNADYIRKIIKMHYAKNKIIKTEEGTIKEGVDHTRMLWKLLIFQLWFNKQYR